MKFSKPILLSLTFIVVTLSVTVFGLAALVAFWTVGNLVGLIVLVKNQILAARVH